MDSPSSSILLSEGSPILILDETVGFWMLVQGSSCEMPIADPEPVVEQPFSVGGFLLFLGL